MPKGTSVQGAINVYRLLWGLSNQEHAVKMVLGSDKANAKGIESNAKILATTIFPLLSPRQILERHTIFGYFSRLLDERVADAWAVALIDLHGRAGNFRQYLPAQGMRLFKPEMWFCADCRQNDQRDFGFSTWRYIHQLHGLAWCPTHGRPLLAFCRNCKSHFDPVTSGRLPGEPCRRCGGLDPVAESSNSVGSSQLATDIASLIDGSLPILRPKNFAVFVRGFVAGVGGVQPAIQAIQEELHKTWGTRQPFNLDANCIEAELRLLRDASYGLSRMVLYGALNRMAPAVQHAVDSNSAVLDDCLAKHNLPLGLASGLQDFRLISELAPLTGVSASRIRAAIADLPESLQLKVTSANRRRIVPAELSAGRSLKEAQLRQKHRNKILWAISYLPSITRTLLWQRLPVPMMWLRKYDVAWLESILPQKIVRGTERFGASYLNKLS